GSWPIFGRGGSAIGGSSWPFTIAMLRGVGEVFLSILSKWLQTMQSRQSAEIPVETILVFIEASSARFVLLNYAGYWCKTNEAVNIKTITRTTFALSNLRTGRPANPGRFETTSQAS